MEQDLRTAISLQPSGRMPLQWVLTSWLDLLGALEHAFDVCHVTHGDPSDGNVLIDECGHASLADWGLGHSFSAETQWPQPSIHGPGTITFAAPERCSVPAVNSGLASDAFALAAVMCVNDVCRTHAADWSRFAALVHVQTFDQTTVVSARAFTCGPVPRAH